MDKPKAGYCTALEWQPSSLALLKEKFEVTKTYDPTDLIDLYHDVLFVDQQHVWNYGRFATVPGIIATNCSSREHLDMPWLLSKDVKVLTLDPTSTGMGFITATAEHTWGLIHALHRDLPERMTPQKWDRRDGFVALKMLSQMSIGIIGYGRIGKMVDKVARAMGMRVCVYDPYNSHDWRYAARDLHELVSDCDIITLHCPLDENTRGMVDVEFLDDMKDDALLINTARGELVDEEALVMALESYTIGGCASDVISGEFTGLAANSPLFHYAHEQTGAPLLLTPHIGGSTISAWRFTEELIIRQALKELGDG